MYYLEYCVTDEIYPSDGFEGLDWERLDNTNYNTLEEAVQAYYDELTNDLANCLLGEYIYRIAVNR